MADDIGGVWRTVGGRRIFIKDGQSLSDAMKASGKFKEKEYTLATKDENGTYRINNVAIELKGMDETYKKDIEQTVKELTEEFDSNLWGVKYSPEEKKEFGNIHMAQTEGNKYQTSIKINGFGEKEIFDKKIADEIARGNITNIDKENYGKYLVTHEFGHSLSAYNLTKSQTDKMETLYRKHTLEVANLERQIKEKNTEFLFDTTKTELVDEVSVLSKQLKETRISKYAMTSMDEFVAESFANYKLNKNPNKYSIEVYNLLKEFNKKWEKGF
jgi:hypothetical protein